MCFVTAKNLHSANSNTCGPVDESADTDCRAHCKATRDYKSSSGNEVSHYWRGRDWKTLVLIHRLAKLVNTDNLGPGSEILVLSFSRNAVTEIRRRLQAFGGAVAYVRV